MKKAARKWRISFEKGGKGKWVDPARTVPPPAPGLRRETARASMDSRGAWPRYSQWRRSRLGRPLNERFNGSFRRAQTVLAGFCVAGACRGLVRSQHHPAAALRFATPLQFTSSVPCRKGFLRAHQHPVHQQNQHVPSNFVTVIAFPQGPASATGPRSRACPLTPCIISIGVYSASRLRVRNERRQLRALTFAPSK